MVNETLANAEATTTEQVEGEAAPPVAPTVEQLQAEIKAWESKYGKEVGDRDRGMARQAETLKQLNERLAAAEKAADALARQAFGEEEILAEVTPYQKWKATHTLQPLTETKPPVAVPPEVAEHKAKIDSLAPQFLDTSGNVKPELQDDWDVAAGKWSRGDMKGAVTKLEQALTKTAPPENTVVKLPVDRTPSQGGVSGSRRVWTEAQIETLTHEEYQEKKQEIALARREGRFT